MFHLKFSVASYNLSSYVFLGVRCVGLMTHASCERTAGNQKHAADVHRDNSQRTELKRLKCILAFVNKSARSSETYRKCKQ